MEGLTIAIAKGRLEGEMLTRLKEVGLGEWIEPKSRKLIFEDKENKLTYIFVKPVDVVTYVQKGVADIGIVGKDVILEQKGDVYELLDLGFGKCTFAIAGFPNTTIYESQKVLRVATKYPTIAYSYFGDRQNIEVIYLNGSVELAPLMGLADVIVDLVETGNTLKANGLVVLEEMFEISAKVICNRVSYRFHNEKINGFLQDIKGGRTYATNIKDK
ncbi:MAG: ATP phosphoribosyltransferase [Bacillaceae bacterium]